MIRLVIILLFASGSLYAQVSFKSVRLKKPGMAIYATSQVEPSIAIDPNDPDRMAAGTVLSDYYYSTNGGKKWKSQTLKSSYGVYGDPVLMFDTTGRLYYFHLASYSKSSHLDRIVCQTTDELEGPFTDGTFTEPNGRKVQDKHWTVLNPVNNEIYMTWTQFDAYDSSNPKDSSFIMFSKSVNQGLTWSKPLRISRFGGDCKDDDNTVEGAVPAVGPDGEIYVTWTGPNGLVFQCSLDGGETWMKEEKKLEDQIGGWTLLIPGIYRANGLPILKCDLSDGPNRGRLYLNWCDQRKGENDTDSWLMYSDDKGENWSKPVKVNQDSTASHQFFTWMTIDQSTGHLFFVYYDRRNYDDNHTDVYLARSADGGATFQEYRLNKKPFVPNSKVFFGDYLNIDAVDGHIRPIWPRMDNAKIRLYVTLVEEEELK